VYYVPFVACITEQKEPALPSAQNLTKTIFPGFGGVNKNGKGEIWIMAKEIKSFSVAPSKEESTINLWQSFGWELKSTQEVKTEDSSHLERRGDSIYSVTKSGEHYIKLTFERDPARQNYAELKSIEEQYHSINDPYCPIEPKRFGSFWGIAAVVGMLWIIPGIAIIIWRISSYPKKKKLYDEAYAVYSREYEAAEKKKRELLEKAKSLI